MFLEKINPLRASIRIRLTVLFVAILAVTLVIFCSILFKVFEQENQKEFDIALYNHAVDVSETINVDFFGDFAFRGNTPINTEKIIPFSLGRSFMQVVSPSGMIMARSANLEHLHLPIFSEDWESVFRVGSAFRTLSSKEMQDIKSAQAKVDYRVITFLTRRNNEPAFILQIAVPTTLIHQESVGLLLFFFVGIPITLVLASLGGFFLSGKALQPVRDIILKAEKLNHSNLSQRLPLPNTRDEIHKLIVTLNHMLGRIQRAFESHEHFIADASHQLKTPIAILRGELDVFKSKERSQEEMNIFVNSAAQELQHLSHLLDDLLVLAQVEAGAGTLSIRSVRLDEIVLDAVSRLELLAKQKFISIRFDMENPSALSAETDFVVSGDADLLQSMFRNLLDNAIKYSPEHSSIEVKIINDTESVLVDIKDYGDPIPPEKADLLFDRYYRDGRLKTRSSGSGLGLTIARRIAEMHRGDIRISHGNSIGKSFIVEIKKI